MMPPNASMVMPQYRFTFTVVSAARSSDEKMPRLNSMIPRIEKNQPVGARRSSMFYRNQRFSTTSIAITPTATDAGLRYQITPESSGSLVSP